MSTAPNTKPVEKYAKLISDLHKKITKITDLDYAVLYTALDQQANKGKPVRSASSGIFDLYVKKKLAHTDYMSSIIGLHTEQKNKYTLIPPDSLNHTFHSVVPTTDGYVEENFSLKDLWWQGTLGSNAIFRVGQISAHTVVNDYAFDDTRFNFVGYGFTDNPTNLSPANALGAVAGINLYKNVYVATSILDGRNVNGYIAPGDVYYKTIELGYHRNLREKYRSDYRIMYWDLDRVPLKQRYESMSPVELANEKEAFPERFRKNTYGAILQLQYNSRENYIPFFRAGWNNHEGTLLKRFVTTGVGVLGLFGQEENVLGVGGVYAKPTDPTKGDEYTIEGYYLLQVTSLLQVTPDIQFIQFKHENEARQWATVFSIRASLLE